MIEPPILISIKQFLYDTIQGKTVMSQEVAAEFAERCRTAILEQFGPQKERTQKRLSALGRPPCQIQAERLTLTAEPESYELPVRMMIGHLVEALVIALIKSSGHKYGPGKKVTLKLDGEYIDGTYDIDEDGIWDIKSSSPWSFNNKFKRGIEALVAEGDVWGYLGQGFGYAEASGKRFRGWIVVNKASGEIMALEVPDDHTYQELREQALRQLKAGLKALNDKEFKRSFSDEPEKFRKVPTGNRILGTTCSMCKYKFACWPGLKMLPSLPSRGENPRLTYYTHIDEMWTNGKDSTSQKG